MKFQTNAMKVKCLAQCFCCCFVLLTCIEPSRQIVKEIFCCRHDFVKGGFLFVCARDGFDRSIDRSMFRLPRAIAWIPYELRSKSIVAKYSRCNNGHDTIHDSLNQYGTVPIYGGLQYLYLIRMSPI